MTDLPAAAIAAAKDVLIGLYRISDDQVDHERMNRDIRAALEAAAPHLTAADPTTETEGFRAYKAGLAAGRAEGAAAERQRIRRFAASHAGAGDDAAMMAVVQELADSGATAERERIIGLASQMRATIPAGRPEGAQASFADYLRVTSTPAEPFAPCREGEDTP